MRTFLQIFKEEFLHNLSAIFTPGSGFAFCMRIADSEPTQQLIIMRIRDPGSLFNPFLGCHENCRVNFSHSSPLPSPVHRTGQQEHGRT
jgi:hypothetical protein